MKLVAISDTHGEHRHVDVGSGDVIVHAGDITLPGDAETAADFIQWFSELNFTHKVFIAGNHDFCFEQPQSATKLEALAERLGVVYLNAGAVEIDGIRFWGSPVTPEFMDWAFMKPAGDSIRRHWAEIPEQTDVLITHGPPYGCCDQLLDPQGGPPRSVGCPELLQRVQQLKPAVHIFGHIHEGYGSHRGTDGVTYINASCMDVGYSLCNPPLELALDAQSSQPMVSAVGVN